ncbi:hypothetical protein GCM10027075_35860 [Streptomyces heilongjiangensis]
MLKADPGEPVRADPVKPGKDQDRSGRQRTKGARHHDQGALSRATAGRGTSDARGGPPVPR